MKIGVIQPLEVKSAILLVEKALKEGAELVLLPEKWTKNIDDVPLVEFQKLAKRYTAYILPGAFEDGVSVITPIIDDSGNLKGIAKKIHLFNEEKLRLIPGNEAVLFTYRGIRFGILICYDIDFPEVARELFSKGVEIILVPSKVRGNGLDIWNEFLRIRVLENRIGIVNANVYSPPDFPGRSVAIVPEQRQDGIVIPKVVGVLGSEEGYMIVDIDPLKYMYLRGDRLKEYVKFTVKEL
ncbi:Nitrilase/cyanide hydratase and apolipoprotein N-acyltransferase [Sulfolobus islandicus Y.G.57.14]|uniref:Nitrilase/cyanide hydratase and apolipoprotein N-acyltransferase n=9 Tax=Saccharolobus islandicus TaxID=43080 RepID=C3MJT1_SACI2|nr:carbon-nitrogen hydrolase family protein [Sulfolobus islandicus]ACP36234.1 Nitrilase/cyanide hydratase and apolipoprotein N-acyltransferase [Sulfolobus islandicus L.S.2.15]ACP38823.1 Nitrilase/cyanide hydratase and apolipoproteinN-acyltransferase [Sulfolobus islandicus M.14.25]ACP46462.1 Nitrilase/cyanide hydratase and apolipoprotein N-acyltransferase [Sulfolobus islandicus Y.G.57.14]ACP56029.1 Nitrilase/cyanide hydratase and apolipoprotein N-acyltransferase [Sulfolobus islandicus M.16.27]A